MADGGDTDKNIEIWKIKKLIKALESARGNGTSMISLIMPPRSHSFFTLFVALRICLLLLLLLDLELR